MADAPTRAHPEPEQTPEPGQRFPLGPFTRRALIVGAVTLAVVVAVLFLWYAGYVLLLIFAAILVGILLQSLSAAVRRFTGLAHGWALGIVVLILLLVTALTLWLFGSSIAAQVTQLTDQLPRGVESLRQQLQRSPWGQRLLSQLQASSQTGTSAGRVFSALSGIFATTVTGLVNLIVVLIVGLYFAATPGVYQQGLVRLVPPAKRARAREVLHVLGYTLRWWLIGRFAVMALNGALTGIALWMLGIPLAFLLGVLTGLLNFIPNIGPILAAIPAILLALPQGPTTVLMVVGLYIVIQNLEGFVLTPLVQQRTVSLPPAVIILSQILLGVLVGTLGVLLATPLAATVFVLVKMLYLEDVLGDAVEVSSTEQR